MPHPIALRPSEIDDFLRESPQYRAVLGVIAQQEVTMSVNLAEWRAEGPYARTVTVVADFDGAVLEYSPRQAEAAGDILHRLADAVTEAGRDAAELLGEPVPEPRMPDSSSIVDMILFPSVVYGPDAASLAETEDLIRRVEAALPLLRAHRAHLITQQQLRETQSS